MPRVVTQADIDAVAPGGTLTLEADATVTSMAAERATSRGVKLVRGGGGDGGRDLVRSVTRAVVARVGHAGPKVVEAVVQEVLASLDGGTGFSALSSPGSPAPAGGGPFIPASTITTPRGSTIVGGIGEGGPMMDVCMACIDQEKKRTRSRAVLTTTGRNTKGIVARVTARIAEMGGDILDISQTLIGDYFTMIIVIDVAGLSVSFERFQEAVQKTVAEVGCQAMVMHDDVMTSLHRV